MERSKRCYKCVYMADFGRGCMMYIFYDDKDMVKYCTEECPDFCFDEEDREAKNTEIKFKIRKENFGVMDAMISYETLSNLGVHNIDCLRTNKNFLFCILEEKFSLEQIKKILVQASEVSLNEDSYTRKVKISIRRKEC